MLCTNAHKILDNSLEATNEKVDLQVVDIMKPENTEWYDKYCYDVPVLHVEKDGRLTKFMHYFFKDKILQSL